MTSGTETPIRVVIVDDHPMIRDGTAVYLRETDDIEVVGVAADGRSGLDQVRQHRPDVLVLDLRLPDMPGVDVARQLRREFPDLSIVVMTGYDYQAYRRELGRMGISTVLGKTASGSEIASAVRAAAAGGQGAAAAEGADPAAEAFEVLTYREYQVLEMLAAGKRNPEIAEAMIVSLKTVEFHVSNLLNKLGSRSRTDAVLRAQGLGLISPQTLPPEAWPLPRARTPRGKTGDSSDVAEGEGDESSADMSEGQPGESSGDGPEGERALQAPGSEVEAEAGPPAPDADASAKGSSPQSEE